MKYFILSFAFIFITGLLRIDAQSKEVEQYRKESEEMRKQVWASDEADFKVREIPKEYANASKVVIARHTELTASSKSKFHYLVITFTVTKSEALTEVVREMVKLNDKNAVKEYSELSFTQLKKTTNFFLENKSTIYVGVRVIKPNGSMKEMNGDDIVLTKDENKEKKAKLAIPDLQPGDILDYFIATVKYMDNDLSIKSYNVLLFDEAPVLSLSFHAQLGKKFSIEYRSYNGAPDLQVSKNDDKEIIVDVAKKNIPPFETSLWVAPGLQLPFIRMNIELGYRMMGLRSDRKPGEVEKNPDGERYLKSKQSDLSSLYFSNYWIDNSQYIPVEKMAKRIAKQNNVSYEDLSDDVKAAQLFYILRYLKLLNFDINKLAEKINIGDYSFEDIPFHLYCALKAGDLDPVLLVSNKCADFRLSELMDVSGVTTSAYLPGTNKFISLQSIYDIPFEAPLNMEGIANTRALDYKSPAKGLRIARSAPAPEETTGPSVPTSNSSNNAHIENLKLSLSPDINNLLVNRSTVLKGHSKADQQKNLILYEDFYEEERKALNEEKSLIESLEDGKKSTKYVDEVTSAFAEARKKQKDAFIKEAKEEFDQEITDLKNYKTDNLGVRHTAPDFVYSSSFNLGGLLKKAGNNIIIEIGKIQGQPFVAKPGQRKRDIDVYMPYARSIEYNIHLQVPEGYTAEGIDALNKKVENETGYFVVAASATDKSVTITIKKHYLHNFEPAANWDKILAFTDAANDWLNAKILLKKK